METESTLARLGWTRERDDELAALGDRDLVPGRVSLEHNHIYRVLTAEGEVLAESAGRLKHEASGQHELPVVGDWVALRVDAAGSRRQIRAVLPRRTWFSRKVAGRVTEEQVVAANIDTVFVVFALDHGVKVRAIERYLVAARHSRAQPVVVLNKVDVAEDATAMIAEAVAAARDVPVQPVSALTGQGVEALHAYLAAGQTIALIGPSGAGKSSLVNRLIGGELLPTGEVRPWDLRGRHISVHRQLVTRAAGGLIVDTPGMRELQLWETDIDGDVFDDIAGLAQSCRFRDCRHAREPGCAVKAAVESGLIDEGRYLNFQKLQHEQAEMAQKKEERAQEIKRTGRVGARAYRALLKDRQRQGR